MCGELGGVDTLVHVLVREAALEEKFVDGAGVLALDGRALDGAARAALARMGAAIAVARPGNVWARGRVRRLEIQEAAARGRLMR